MTTYAYWGMRFLAILLFVPVPVLAQTVRFGVRGGLPISVSLSANRPYNASTQRYVIGPMVEISLPYGFAAGADFLLQAATVGVAAATSRATVRRWEFPVLLTYHTRSLPAHPFVRAGLSFNRVFDVGGATECGRGPFGEQFYCLGGSNLVELRHRGTHGPVVAGGLQWRFHRIRIESEVRVTRWIDRNFGVWDSAVRSNLSEIEILVGVTF